MGYLNILIALLSLNSKEQDAIDVQSKVNLFLTLLVWIPGVIHAFMVTNRYYADKRNNKLIRELKQNSN